MLRSMTDWGMGNGILAERNVKVRPDSIGIYRLWEAFLRWNGALPRLELKCV